MLTNIDLVCNYKTGASCVLIALLYALASKVLMNSFPIRIKDKDAGMRSGVVKF